MCTHISEPCRTNHRVHDGMENDVGVAVTREAAAVRDRDAAEHHWPFPGEGVDVEAHSRPGGQAAGEPLLRLAEVLHSRELLERGIAGDGRDAHARSARDGRLVRRGLAVPRGISVAESLEAESLRRLDAHEA